MGGFEPPNPSLATPLGSATTLIEANALPLSQTANIMSIHSVVPDGFGDGTVTPVVKDKL